MAASELKILARNILLVRKTWGLTQSQFGRYFDLTRAQVSSYEQELAQPKIEFIFQLGRTLGKGIESLFEENLSPNDVPSSPIDGKKERTKVAPVRSMDDPLMNHITLVEFTRELEERIAKIEELLKKQ